MSGYLPDSFVERLREQADILRIVGDYVPLKKAGARYRALCPFHDEKTPSFYVSPGKNIFHCFGCGVGGDAFAFIMRMEKVDFPEAIRLVAEKMGLPIPEPPSRQPRDADEPSPTDIYEIYKKAHHYYVDQLWQGPHGRIARDYMKQRSFSEDVLRQAGLGYAPPQWSALSDHLRKKGASPKLLERSGLAKPSTREESGLYDTFRGRVLFPICNVTGKIIAFGGRSLDDEEQPKYLNSPEHPVYRKSRTLFGLHLTKAAVEKKGFAILVEGYMDWLRLWQEGVDNAVAVCGTAFTAEHAALLKRYTSQVLLNFDSDPAGAKATLSSIEALLEREMSASVLSIPSGQDPDDFMRQQGRQAYLSAMRSARPALDFLLDHFSSGATAAPKAKVEALRSLLPYLQRIPSAIERSDYVARISHRLGVELSLLRAEIERLSREQRLPSPAQLPRPSEVFSRSAATMLHSERALLVTALEAPSRATSILSRLTDEDIEAMSCPNLWRVLMQTVNRGEEPGFSALFQETLPESEREALSAIAASEETLLQNDEEIEGALEAIRVRQVDKQLRRLQEEIQEAEKRGDGRVLEALTAEKMRLSQKKAGIP